MSEPTNTAERTEEVVAQVMRATRDEKLRLDTLLAERTDTMAALTLAHAELAVERDHYLKRATQLETDLRAMIAVLNDALNTKAIFSRGPPWPAGGETLGEGPAPEYMSTLTNPATRRPIMPNKRPYD